MRYPRVLGAVIALAFGTVGCASMPTGTAEPPRYAPKDQTTAEAARSSARPLVLEWPAADRAALESQRASGVVVVRYAQHEMEVLRGCRADAAYRYVSITPKEEALVSIPPTSSTPRCRSTRYGSRRSSGRRRRSTSE